MAQVQQLYHQVFDFVSSGTFIRSTQITICLIAVASFLHLRNRYSYWSRKGIKNPTPIPILGNLAHMLTGNRMKNDLERVQRYGKVYGLYFGTTPHLVIADPEVLQEITIKSFDAFQNHGTREFSDKFANSFLIFLQGDHWKRVRALMSPTFTSGKIKRMFRFLDNCADDLVACFREQLIKDKKGEETAQINAKELYNLFTMDAITTCCYGIKLERAGASSLKATASRNEFVRDAMRFFEFNVFRNLMVAITPKPILRALKFRTRPQDSLAPLEKKVENVIKWRRDGTKKLDDYLQLLLDAKLENKLELDELDLEENHHAGLTRESLLEDQEKLLADINKNRSIKETALSDFEVKANAMFLLVVGLETTGTLLTNCTYSLAFHQDIQEKLYEELLKIVEYNEDKTRYSFNYEALTSCKYLDAVISETLRVISPVLLIDRIANRDYYIEKYKIEVPKGSHINLSYYAVMNDPDYWEEPTKFNPDRFMPGNKEKIVPGSYCPFGLGPRHCIGMRFSLTEAKLALAKIMMNFKFDPVAGFSFPPEPKTWTLSVNSIAKPFVKISPRQK